jgi:hypothetical protein
MRTPSIGILGLCATRKAKPVANSLIGKRVSSRPNEFAGYTAGLALTDDLGMPARLP